MAELRMEEKRAIGRYERLAGELSNTKVGESSVTPTTIAILVLAATIDEVCQQEFLVRQSEM